MLPKDYIRFCMCSEAATDVTDASSTGIFDVKRRQWAWELIDRLGLQREMFPVCGEAFERGGSVILPAQKKQGSGRARPYFWGAVIP